MGLNYNPASVTQGLVYYLDLTNSRCYSGSGNTLTNLANGAIGITIVSGITYDTDYRKNLNFPRILHPQWSQRYSCWPFRKLY